MQSHFSNKSLSSLILAISLLISYSLVSASVGQTQVLGVISGSGMISYAQSGLVLTFEAYDLNLAQELRISINGQIVDSLPAVDNPQGSGVWMTSFTFNITAYCQPTGNYLRFDNPFPYGASKVRNVKVTSSGTQVFFSAPEAKILGDPTAPTYVEYGPFSISQDQPPPPSPPPPSNLTAWYGIGEDYKLTMAYDTTGNPDYLTVDWPSVLNDQRFKQWKFNVNRLDFHFADLGTNPNFADDVDLDYGAYASVVRLLASYGYKVVATDHSWANFGSQKWMDDWTNFVTWLNQPGNTDVRDAIVAYELRNECGGWTYEQGPWWNGLYMPDRNSPPTGWNWWEMVTAAYAHLTDLIQAIQPGALVTRADPAAYYQSTVRSQDIRDGVVYAWHCWTNDADDKGHTEPISMANWANNYLGPKYPNSRNWMGEFGSWYQTASPGEGTCTYAGQKYTFTSGSNSLMQWSLNNNVGFSMQYWKNWNKEDEYSDWLMTVGFPSS